MKSKIELDKVIHQPIRTKIMVLLADVKEADFNTIKVTLELHDGHMSTHMNKLLINGYAEVKKEFVKNKPKSTYKLTKKGKEKLIEYIKNLKKIISL